MKFKPEFSISMYIDGGQYIELENSDFNALFERFLSIVEDSVLNNSPIDQPVFKFGDYILGTDITEILKIGAGFSNSKLVLTSSLSSDFMINSVQGFAEKARELSYLNWKDVRVSIKGSRPAPYEVFHNSIPGGDIKYYIIEWFYELYKGACDKHRDAIKEYSKDQQDHEINPVILNSPQMSGSSWVLNYYLPQEVQRAKDLIDSNPEEAKKVLDVMAYILQNSKEK